MLPPIDPAHLFVRAACGCCGSEMSVPLAGEAECPSCSSLCFLSGLDTGPDWKVEVRRPAGNQYERKENER